MNLYESLTKNLKESYSDTEYSIIAMMSYVLNCINSLKVPTKSQIEEELKDINSENDTTLSLNTFVKRVDTDSILNGGPEIGGLNITEKDIPKAIEILKAFGIKATKEDFSDFVDDSMISPFNYPAREGKKRDETFSVGGAKFTYECDEFEKKRITELVNTANSILKTFNKRVKVEKARISIASEALELYSSLIRGKGQESIMFTLYIADGSTFRIEPHLPDNPYEYDVAYIKELSEICADLYNLIQSSALSNMRENIHLS